MSTVLPGDADVLFDKRLIVRVGVLKDAVRLEVSPTSLAGMADPTPLLVHGVGIESVAVLSASLTPYMLSVV